MPNIIANPGYEGATFVARSPAGTVNPDQWPLGNEAYIATPGHGGASCLALPSYALGATSQAISRSQLASYTIPGTSPSGGIFTCPGDAGGPGVYLGTVSYFMLNIGKVYPITFWMQLILGSTVQDFRILVGAASNNNLIDTCGGTDTVYGTIGNSAGGATSLTLNTWGTIGLGGGGTSKFVAVPNNPAWTPMGPQLWQQYTITLDTTPLMGTGLPDPFFAYLSMNQAGIGAYAEFRVDDWDLTPPLPHHPGGGPAFFAPALWLLDQVGRG